MPALASRRRLLAILVGVAVVAGVGAYLLLRGSGERVLLDRTVRMGSAPTVMDVRIPAPGDVEIRVDLPEDAATDVSLAPAPGPSSGFQFRAKGPRAAARWRVPAAGSYAVVVMPWPVAMGDMPPTFRVRVVSLK